MKKRFFVVLLITSIFLSACSKPDFELKESDVVDGNNFKNFTDFLEHVNEKEEDDIRIINYTNEGDPLIWNLSFDGKIISAEYDMSYDKWGSGKIHYNKCESILEEKKENYTEYKLTGCKNEKLIKSLLIKYETQN